MMTIQRYSIYCEQMIECDNGDIVKYDDHIKELQERAEKAEAQMFGDAQRGPARRGHDP